MTDAFSHLPGKSSTGAQILYRPGQARIVVIHRKIQKLQKFVIGASPGRPCERLFFPEKSREQRHDLRLLVHFLPGFLCKDRTLLKL